MFNRLKFAAAQYPRQFWLLFWGMLISTIGTSMVWPFLMIYVSGKLNLPLATAASLMTVNAATGIVVSFLAGSIADRVGRKGVMVVSLLANAAYYLMLSQANSLPAFVALMVMGGAVTPLYRVGADAMMADIIPAEQRADAYSLLRMSNNLGLSVGPTIGGFIAAISYTISFTIGATGLAIYGFLLLFFARETLPNIAREPRRERLGGYDRVVRDGPFITFVLNFTLTQMTASMMWVLMSVYTKTNFGMSESQYGWIPATNAIMVVTLQVLITNFTKRRPPIRMMALGTLFFAVGVGSIALGTGFSGFWLSMVITTIGELILVPTTTTYAANLAPAEMRGRYMSVYGLSWNIAQATGPVLGGFLNDNIAPQAIWWGAGLIGFISLGIFMMMARRQPPQPATA